MHIITIMTMTMNIMITIMAMAIIIMMSKRWGIKMILFLAGTSDARELAIKMQKAGFPVLATVVTESAAKSLEDAGISTRVGRLSAEDMTSLISAKSFQAVVDASHPFAEEASKNALQGAKAANIPYIRYERKEQAVSKR